MKRYFEQLKPSERRVVAVVGLIVFIVLNWIFVRPYFSDWSKVNGRMATANANIIKYRAELAHKPEYERKIKDLQAGGASEVLPEDQAMDLVHYYSSRANSNGVQIINNSRLITRTNDPFFVDQEIQLNVQGKESQMVNFLYTLGAGNSIVRVRAISLHPDGAHQQINANISIVASYQKKLPVRTSAPASPAAKTVADTATSPDKAPRTNNNKALVTVSHNNAATNKPVPLTVKRP